VTIGDANFELFTSGDGAWADSADRDRQIVEAMKAGTTMRLRGTCPGEAPIPPTGTRCIGVTAAMTKIDEECS
jgi:hypothetical protein